MAKLDFESLWKAYPFSDRKDGGSAEDVKTLVGGRVDAAWIRNTCAIRISRALNYAGHPLPSDFSGKKSNHFAVSGSDGKWYAFRVRDMHAYLTHLLGEPNISETSKENNATVRGKFLNKKGVIVFDVAAWDDATGHITLWNGSQCADKCYFAEAVRVDMWTLT